jgi:hypothetical protein
VGVVRDAPPRYDNPTCGPLVLPQSSHEPSLLRTSLRVRLGGSLQRGHNEGYLLNEEVALNYWDLIRDAFWITLRNRYLWFFGFFAGVGCSSNFNFNFPRGGGGFDDNDFDRSSASSQFFGQLPFDGPLSGVGVAALIGLVLLGLLTFLVVVILAVISNGGLADSVVAIDRGMRA